MQECGEDELKVSSRSNVQGHRNQDEGDNNIDNEKNIEDGNSSGDTQESIRDSQRKGEPLIPVEVEANSKAMEEIDIGQHGRDQVHDQKYHDQQENQEEPEQGPPKQHLRFEDNFQDNLDVVPAEKDKESKCCRARTLCTILTMTLMFLSGTAVGFALFERTRYYSLVVIVPLICASFFSCLLVMCYISAREGDEVTDDVMIVIDPSADLPVAKKKRKLKWKKKREAKKKEISKDFDDLNGVNNGSKINSSKSSTFDCTVASTVAISADTDCCDDDDEDSEEKQRNRRGESDSDNDKGYMATTFPEIYRTVENTQRAFEEATDYIIQRIFRPATAICRPSTVTTRSSSVDPSLVPVGLGTGSRLGRSRSRNRSGFITETDVECCVDVHCLRDEYGAVNLSGTYKLFHNQNFDGFLKAVKVPALLRRPALATRPVHKYTHEGKSFRVQIEGIIKGDTTFTIHGPPTISSMRHLKFLDHVTYTEDKGGIVVRKVLQNRPKNFSNKDTSEIIVTREMNKTGKKMLLTSVAIGGDGSVIAKSIQTFHRI